MLAVKMFSRVAAIVVTGIISVLVVQLVIRKLYNSRKGQYYDHSSWESDH